MTDERLMLYLYEDERGDMQVVSIFEDLGKPLNPDKLQPEMLHPRTPDTVRAMLYNAHFLSREKKQFVKSAKLHTTPSGLRFLEVRLTFDGLVYIKARFSGGHMMAQTYSAFDPQAPWPVNPRPKPRLREALHYLGFKPQ